MRDIPKTNSPSSAKRLDDQSVPDYGSQADRITINDNAPGLGNTPIKITKNVKYKDYENDKRMTEDFSEDKVSDDQTQDFGGVETMEPASEPEKTFINTSFSEK